MPAGAIAGGGPTGRANNIGAEQLLKDRGGLPRDDRSPIAPQNRAATGG